ncbi:hypothetical protein K437DRAFT_276601 [Tilletiaria anomala UBC 951]|uniref:Pre-rRNA-processing protein RIX1 N-terminal domain-containing protein n=1 Tax=Tilletiaria anomala (strain ATCC 24038 / CBS 436.72 / UBC 951) TaxID=1037660 RepID=A0A066V727_TILAU|nr:uncharacterized protein K437DRAFT_276601 [Tilletiaria anomala UBC 951]KDN37271.1 hypothetical protein K437DRAFT_276601 [Tilletiaria anomala UBC 951]
MTAVIGQASALLSLLDQGSSSSASGLSLERASAVQDEFLHAIQEAKILGSLAEIAFGTSGTNSDDTQGQIHPHAQSNGKESFAATALAANASSLLVKFSKRANSLLPGTTPHHKQDTSSLIQSHVLGFNLALALTRQVGWPIISFEDNAVLWLSAAFQILQAFCSPTTAQNHISSAREEHMLESAIELAGKEILGLANGSAAGKSGNAGGVMQGGEFMRTVITPNLPKYAQLLTSALESSQGRGDLRAVRVLLDAITSELHTYSSLYRPLSARIHACCIQLLFPPHLSPYALPPLELVQSASKLLINLHRTGALSSKVNGAEALSSTENTAGRANTRATQAQLWTATIETAIGTFQTFVDASVSTILPSASANPSHQASSSRGSRSIQRPTFQIHEDWRPDEGQDSVLEHTSHLTFLRYSLFVLLEMLRQPTAPQAVISLPLRSFLLWATGISPPSCGVLRMTRKYSVQRPGTEQSVFVLQMTSLEATTQQAVLLVLLRLFSLAGAGALEAVRPPSSSDGDAGGSSLLWTLVDLYDANTSARGSQSPSDFGSLLLRSIAFLIGGNLVSKGEDPTHGLALPLEPSSRLVSRLSKLSASTLARYLLGSTTRERLASQGGGAAKLVELSTSGRPSKRSKNSSGQAFNTDTIFGSVGNGIPAHISRDEAAGVLASFNILTFLYPHLTAKISADTADLATMTAALARATVEATLVSGVVLSTSFACGQKEAATLQVRIVVGSLHLLDVVLHHSTSSTLALILTGLHVMLSPAATDCSGTFDPMVRTAAQRCLATLQKIVQPRMVPVPEWNLDVVDTNIAWGSANPADKEEKKVDIDDAHKRAWLETAAKDVLELDVDLEWTAASANQLAQGGPAAPPVRSSAVHGLQGTGSNHSRQSPPAISTDARHEEKDVEPIDQVGQAQPKRIHAPLASSTAIESVLQPILAASAETIDAPTAPTDGLFADADAAVDTRAPTPGTSSNLPAPVASSAVFERADDGMHDDSDSDIPSIDPGMSDDEDEL